MFIPLLIYILIGIIWNINHIKQIRTGFETAIEKYNKEPSIAVSLFTLMLIILLWGPVEIYALIRGIQIAKKNNDDEESK